MDQPIRDFERRLALHQAALDVLDGYKTRGLPFALYFRKYSFDVLHGPEESERQLVENTLREAMPPGANVITIQDHGDLMYTGDGTAFDRGAPALLLKDDEWHQAVEELIPFADLIVSECYLMTDGVRFELETAYRTSRCDRTVLILPPTPGPLAAIDSDPLIQMFPRAIWADIFHTKPLADLPPIADLIERMRKLAAMPEDQRINLTDPDARLRACPIDLLAMAIDGEGQTMMSTVFGDKSDPQVRYYGFWTLFRAASARSLAMLAGRDTPENRTKLAGDYLQMSILMGDNEKEGERIVMIGDLTFAEQSAKTAYVLADNVATDHHATPGDRVIAEHLRDRAERRSKALQQLSSVMKAEPGRFLVRPRYGPFPVGGTTLADIDGD